MKNHSIDRQKKEAIELQVSTAALIFADSLILYKSALNTSFQSADPLFCNPFEAAMAAISWAVRPGSMASG